MEARRKERRKQSRNEREERERTEGNGSNEQEQDGSTSHTKGKGESRMEGDKAKNREKKRSKRSLSLGTEKRRRKGEKERRREVEKEEGIGRKEKEAKIAAFSVLNHRRTTQYRITGIYMHAYIPDTCMYTYEDKFVATECQYKCTHCQESTSALIVKKKGKVYSMARRTKQKETRLACLPSISTAVPRVSSTSGFDEHQKREGI